MSTYGDTVVQQHRKHESDWELIAVKLPERVYSEHSVLSSSLEMRLGNLSGRLLFPNTKSPQGGLRLTAPTGPPPWVGHPEYSSAAPSWGYWNSRSTATVESVVFHIEHLTHDDRVTYPAGFLETSRQWVSGLADWLAVLAGGTTDIVGHDMLTWQSWDIETEALGESQRSWMEPDSPLSLDQWQFCVDKISNNEKAPFELALIAAARRSAALGDYRRAVFDAASAAEMVLRDALQRHVFATEGVSPTFFKWAIERKTFGPLVQACEKFGLALPEQTMAKLVTVRNSVAHPASPPSEENMRQAVSVAAEIVYGNYEMEADLQEIIKK